MSKREELVAALGAVIRRGGHDLAWVNPKATDADLTDLIAIHEAIAQRTDDSVVVRSPYGASKNRFQRRVESLWRRLRA